MSELKRRDYVTWEDVGIVLDHMRKEYGLVGTVEVFRAEDKNNRPISKVGIVWRNLSGSPASMPFNSPAITWPHNSWKSVPSLILFIVHRDEDLWLKLVINKKTEQAALPF